MTVTLDSPKAIHAQLGRDVVDQAVALEQISVALYKHLQHIKVGNIMLIGNSGTGKTTIMRSIERLFSEHGAAIGHQNTIRLNANIVSNDESTDLESSVILARLAQNAHKLMGSSPNVDQFRDLIENAVVFLDEVDKIRAYVGDKPNPRGILAQESLLTLIEGEGVSLPLSVRNEQGGFDQHKVPIDTGRILFICGGAFEGLYDMVYRRVAGGETRDKLIQEYVVTESQEDMEQKIHFSLNDYVRYEDMFEYGMTPQFLGRFDEVIVLNDLTIKGLMRIFVDPPNSLFREARRYFASLGIELQASKEAVQRIAEHAYDNHRLGARALRMVFKRIMRGIEFDPHDHYLVKQAGEKKVLLLTRDLVDRYF
ncbi:AAA family ATPase [Acanthopleuribacter pedis]|uniref:AAA family ATPase n=1 Tax=Acanthopleuribacter pedis TaxID=442870 RepID=A0A8J7U477_9BACT|nr:AAA family ATPase [Acanthopleuribacter pedis]MBO1319123.1 AAA family ATPase [Acanthopleuribacter pedis]